MSDTQDQSSKTEAPTGRRIQQAREEGQVAKSPEVASFLALTAGCTALLLDGGSVARQVAGDLMPFIAHPDAIDLSAHGAQAVFRAAFEAATPAVVIVASATAAGVAGNLIQHGLLFSPKAIMPNFSKIGFSGGLKRLIGIDNMLNFGKNFLKLIAMGLVVWSVLKPHARELAGLAWMEPAAVLPFACEVLRAVTVAALVVFGVSAGVDYFIQRWRFTERLKMSREEIKKEHKDSEGDPQIKAKVRQLRMQRAKNRMINNVPKATLVIMNPTHYAVALRYVQGETAAPVCVAKGLDEVALKIREIAEQHRVPVIEDPPLARALYATIDLDETIPREHYEAVAKIVGFVMGKGRRRARPMRGGLGRAPVTVGGAGLR
ncbi:MAG: flagellar biosynthesis protein FlhB [Caulobacteraceae bacterium]